MLSAISGFRYDRWNAAIFLPILLWSIFGLYRSGWGQSASTGAVMGEILDLVGGGIPSASIEVRNLDTGVVRSTTSDDKGQFALPLLSPGTYQLVVVKAGFAQTQLTSVKVTVTETTRVSIPMKIAGVSEHVEVQATVSELQRDSVALGALSILVRLNRYRWRIETLLRS
jgi:Carboxypeptidase regulatory-like domain